MSNLEKNKQDQLISTIEKENIKDEVKHLKKKEEHKGAPKSKLQCLLYVVFFVVFYIISDWQLMILQSSHVNLALQKYFLELNDGDKKIHSQYDLDKFDKIHS